MNIFMGNSVKSTFETIKKYRASYGTPGVYLLVDRINGIPSAFEDALANLPSSARTPLVDASLVKYPEKALELVWLTEAEDEVLAYSVELAYVACQNPKYGYGHSIVAGWLFSGDPARLIVRDCLTLFDQIHANGEGVFFRAFDPRIRNTIKRISSAPLSKDMLGGALAWAYLNNDGHLLIDSSTASSKLELDRPTWKALDRLTHLHPALMQWAESHQQYPDEGIIKHADELVRRAIDIHHLTEAEDIKSFVSFGLDQAPTFDQQTEVLQAIQKTVKQNYSLADQFAILKPGQVPTSLAPTES